MAPPPARRPARPARPFRALLLAALLAAPPAAAQAPDVTPDALFAFGPDFPALIARLETALGFPFLDVGIAPDHLLLRVDHPEKAGYRRMTIEIERVADPHAPLAPILLEKADPRGGDDGSWADLESLAGRFKAFYRRQSAPARGDDPAAPLRRDLYLLAVPGGPGPGLLLRAETEALGRGFYPAEINPLERLLPLLLSAGEWEAYLREVRREEPPPPPDPRLARFIVRAAGRFPSLPPPSAAAGWAANARRFACADGTGVMSVGNVEESFLGGDDRDSLEARLAARILRDGGELRDTCPVTLNGVRTFFRRYGSWDRVGFAAAVRASPGELPFVLDLRLPDTDEATLSAWRAEALGGLFFAPAPAGGPVRD